MYRSIENWVFICFWYCQVALAHTIGHVAATVSMSKVAVSFTHIIKSAEPAFSVLVSRFLLGEHFPIPVYLSLIPIIGGCGLAALTELNFNMTGDWSGWAIFFINRLNCLLINNLNVNTRGFPQKVYRTNLIYGYFRLHGSYDFQLGFCISQHILKEGHEGEVSGRNELLCLSFNAFLGVSDPFCTRCGGAKALGRWMANSRSGNRSSFCVVSNKPLFNLLHKSM